MDNLVKLHLGCGKRFLPGFIHVDKDSYDHVDYRQSMTDLEKFADNTVELIYSCHSFNYLDENQARQALKEWFRVLCPGGLLRLAVPDFAAIAVVYTRNKELSLLSRLITGYYQSESKVEWHRSVYDESSLSKLLQESGFVAVQCYDWRLTDHADVDDYSQAYLPHMEKKTGTLMSLNIEARAGTDC